MEADLQDIRGMIHAGCVLACGVLALAGTAGAECGIPGLRGGVRVFDGDASVNEAPVRFIMSSLSGTGEAAGEDGVLHRLALADGWRDEGGSSSMPTPRGVFAVRRYRRGECRLMQGFNSATGLVMQALFTELPPARDVRDEAPGRDPAGVPRFGGARRVLHMAGRGCEVAFYRTPMRPPNLVSESVARLRQMGWKAEALGEAMLSATRRGRPDILVMISPEGDGSVYMVMTTEVVR